MSKARFSKHLKELNIEEMRHELLQLYARVPEVRQFYAMELGTDKDRKRIYDKAKKDIASKYATKSYRRPRRPRIQKINKVLSTMAKSSIFQHELADLYLFDIETALVFIVRYHFYSQVLGNHITSVYKKALDIIEQEQVQDMFQDRSKAVVDRAELIPDIHWQLLSRYRECYSS